MKKFNIYFTLLLSVLVLALNSCDEEDNTGYSSLKPSNTTISVDVPTTGITLTEADSTFTFNVTLSEPQIVDIAVYITQIGGTATSGEDFKINNNNSRVFIPAYRTTGEVSITIFEDDLAEEVETLTLQIGDKRTANAEITPVTVEFSIGNFTESELVADLEWTTDALDAIGIDMDPYEAVDLRFLLIAADTIFDVSDGSSAESLNSFNTLPDGEYTLAVDIYSSVDAGELDNPLTLDLMVTFNQVGVINDKMLSFEQIMTDKYTCSLYRVNLLTVTKTGDSYAFAKDVESVLPEREAWSGTDGHYIIDGEKTVLDAAVETRMGCDGYYIFGLNAAWMSEFWGEEVIEEGEVFFTVDKYGDVTIDNQYVFTTLYNGEEYEYTISGTGTYDDSGATPTITIQYTLDQDGTDPSDWAYNNDGYMDTPYFTATLTKELTAAPLSVKRTVKNSSVLKNKPVK